MATPGEPVPTKRQSFLFLLSDFQEYQNQGLFQAVGMSVFSKEQNAWCWLVEKAGSWSSGIPCVFAMAFPQRCWSGPRLKLAPGQQLFLCASFACLLKKAHATLPGEVTETSSKFPQHSSHGRPPAPATTLREPMAPHGRETRDFCKPWDGIKNFLLNFW